MKPRIDKYVILFGLCTFLFVISFWGSLVSLNGNNSLNVGYAITELQECGCKKCHTIELDSCNGCHESNNSQTNSVEKQINTTESNDSDTNTEVEEPNTSEPEPINQNPRNPQSDNSKNESNKSPRK